MSLTLHFDYHYKPRLYFLERFNHLNAGVLGPGQDRPFGMVMFSEHEGRCRRRHHSTLERSVCNPAWTSTLGECAFGPDILRSLACAREAPFPSLYELGAAATLRLPGLDIDTATYPWARDGDRVEIEIPDPVQDYLHSLPSPAMSPRKIHAILRTVCGVGLMGEETDTWIQPYMNGRGWKLNEGEEEAFVRSVESDVDSSSEHSFPDAFDDL